MPNSTIPTSGRVTSATCHRSRRAALRLFGAAVAASAPLVLATPAAQAIAGATIDDPALAAVAAFDAARAAWEDAPDDDDVVDPLFAEFERTNHALGRVILTTRQGAAAVLRRLVEEEMNCVDEASPLYGAIYNLLAFLEGDSDAPLPAGGRAQS
jgi:hypothetical protein